MLAMVSCQKLPLPWKCVCIGRVEQSVQVSRVLSQSVQQQMPEKRSRRGRLNTSPGFAPLAPELPKLGLIPLCLVSLNGFLPQGMYDSFFVI